MAANNITNLTKIVSKSLRFTKAKFYCYSYDHSRSYISFEAEKIRLALTSEVVTCKS